VIGWLDVAEATKWTEDPTVDPLVGDDTETVAMLADANASTAQKTRACFFKPISL
jgi:hypothetical protein